MVAGISASPLVSVADKVEKREPPPVTLRYENTPTTRRGAGPSRHANTIANRAKRARARLSRKKG